MGRQEELKAKAAFHDFEAIFANSQRRKFDEGKLFSPNGHQAPEYEAWVKETTALLHERETSHIAARESFLRLIEK
jgi:hypothetical protein